MKLRFDVRQLAKEEDGMAPLTSVMVLAVAAIVLLGMRFLWDAKSSNTSAMAVLEKKYELLLNGGEGADGTPHGNGGNGADPGNTGGGSGGGSETVDPEPPEPPGPQTPNDREREIALLERERRRTEGMARIAQLMGREVEAKRLTILADAIKLDIARIKGPEHLKTEMAAIAARRTLQGTADVFLKAIQKRIPITRFVRAPILDGAGQLTEEFVKWWNKKH